MGQLGWAGIALAPITRYGESDRESKVLYFFSNSR